MKRAVGATAIACTALVAACRQAPAPAEGQGEARKPSALLPVKVLEHEPNDAQHAQGIPERSLVIGALEPARKGLSDDDWYRVTPGPGVLLALRVELAAGEPGPRAELPAGAPEPLPREPLDAALEVYDRDRNRLLRTRATADAPALLPAVACLEACFLRVSGSTPAAYRMTVLGAPPQEGQELEPNDRAVDATPLAAGRSVQGTFATPEDEDWYKLTIPAPRPGQFLRVELSGVPGVRPELELRALADGALLGTFRGSEAGDSLLLRDLPLGDEPPAATAPAALPAPTNPGNPANQPAAAPPANADPLPASTEPRPAGPAPAPGAGPPVPSPASPPGSPTPSAAPAAAAAAAQADAPRTAATPAATVAVPPPVPPPPGLPPPASQPPASPSSALPSTGAAAATSPATAPPSTPPAPTVAPAGYYLVLRSAPLPAEKGARPRRGANAGVAYTLSTAIESGPPDLEREPNDDPAHATPLTSSRTGFLAPAGDVDWYRLDTAAPALLRLEVTALERADLELSVWLPPERPGEKPRLLARANEGGVREGELLPAVGLPAGGALVKVESALREIDGRRVRDGEDRGAPYHLTAQLSPDDGRHDKEPNDDLEHAQPVALPLQLSGTIWPHRDVDLFRFRVEPGRGPVSVRLSAVRGVDLMLRLLQLGQGRDGRPKAEVIGTSDAAHGEGEEAILAVPLKPGDYAIEVSSPRGKDASATQPYLLTAQ